MIKSHFKRIIVGCVVGVACAAVYWKMTPRIYQGSAQIFVNAGSGGRANDAMSALVALGVSQSAASEASLLHSEGTFKRALENISDRTGNRTLRDPDVQADLFMLYDIEMDRESKVMMVQARAYDPQTAADIANEVVNVYNEMRKNTSTAAYSNAQMAMNDQLATATAGLSAAEKKLKAYQEATGMTDVGSATGSVASYLATLSQQKDATASEDAELSQSISETKMKIAALPKTTEIGMSLVRSPALDAIEMRMTEYEKQRTEMLRVYTPTSSKIADLDGIIARTGVELANAKKTEWQKQTRSITPEPIRSGLEAQKVQEEIKLVQNHSRMRSLNKALAAQNAIAATLPAKQKRFAELIRERNVFQDKYMNLKSQVEDLKLQSSSAIAQAANLYPAVANQKAISPLASKLLPLGLIAGGIFGLLYSFVRESFRSTARTSEELSTLFELPVVATVPALPEAAIKKNFQSLSGKKHIPAEAFRFMASAAALAKNGPRRVVFTSSGGNVGCSSAAAEFAVAAAKMGIQTILVDADLTFGKITRAFKMTDKPGIRDILGRKLLASDGTSMTHPTEHHNLTVLPIGADDGTAVIADSPQAMLQGLLESLQEYAELIVVDCPPIDVVADTSRFVPLVDEVCLVVSARKTSLQSIALSRALLDRCGAKTISVVLTGAAPREEAFTGFNRYIVGRR